MNVDDVPRAKISRTPYVPINNDRNLEFVVAYERYGGDGIFGTQMMNGLAGRRIGDARQSERRVMRL